MKLLFGADLVPTENSEQLFIDKDFKTLFGDIKDIVSKYDRFIVNNEYALTNEEQGIRKMGPCLKADPRCADAMKEFGITDAMLANNHVMDYGIKGLRDTVYHLERVGIGYAGLGENDEDSRKAYYIEDKDVKVAIINVCEHEYSYALPNRFGTNPYSPFKTMRDIKKAKENADYVIVIYHGGKEYCCYPSPRLLEHSREMILSGADVVLTQHSHCIGCYEEYEGGHILYGQGNFHFVKENSNKGWYTSLLVGLEIDNGIKVNFYPIYQTEKGMDVAKGEKANEIMSAFEKRNKQLLDGTWTEGWDEFCKSVEGTYRYCLSPQHAIDFENYKPGSGKDMSDQVIAHYVDCEAHEDVIRHLFRTWHLTEKY